MRLTKLFLLSTALTGLVPTAYAQTADTAPADADAQTYRDNEIVVTAQKRSERLNDVAEAVTAFTAETRQIIGITDLGDMAQFTPGLSYNAGSDRVFLRGIGRQTNTAGSDPGVATYIDGIYDSATSSVAGSDFFVDRVEILRGPQGTLYGRNSIGGAINAISKRPTHELSIEGRATIANYNAYSIQGAVSGPLTDGLRVKLGGSWFDQDKGYFRNVAGGRSEGGVSEGYYLEGQVELDLGPQATLWLKATTTRVDQRPRAVNSDTPWDYAPYPSGALTPGSQFGFLFPGYQALGSATSNPGVDNIREFSADTEGRARTRGTFSVQGQLDVELEPFDIRILGGYRETRYDSIADLDGSSMTEYRFPLAPGAVCGFVPGCTPLTVNPSQTFGYVEDRSFGSAEINFLSKGDGPLNWLAGLYYYGEILDQESHFGTPNQAQMKAPANGPANPTGDSVFAGTNLETASYAAFGQIDWDVTSTVRLTGGLRYSIDEKRAIESLRAVCLGCAAGLTADQLGSLTPALDITSTIASFAPADGVVSATTIDPVTGRARRVLDDSWNSFSGTAGIQWRPAANSLVYANYSRGYKSGGFNAGGITASPRTGSEHVNAYQAGVKQGFGRVQLNVAGYYYDYRGLQIPLSIPTPSINLTGFFNLERAKSWGTEVEASWQPVDGLQLLLNYAYADSKIKSCCYFDGADPTASAPGAQPSGPAVGGRFFQSLDGEELPFQPRHKLAANANYTFDVGPGSVTLSASYSWRAKMWASVFNRSYYRVPTSESVDLRLLWTGKDDRYRVIFFAKNLFDTTSYDNIGGLPGSSVASPYVLPLTPGYLVNRSIGVEAPRTYGVQLSFKI
ncbi:iron complex outermembrane receptor protein [Sphingopyxis panaciterrae]|uniref:TonB-dependent receptor n=1 Tax=Sphingopyxis panaciterrae TaxID=363841 RepID=UPI00141F8C1F|nr:TonB-dependent receptor [Sphingopyxis panaciterrae]NIJ37760.1 iron complex outermembrane receptor protein [Sphingopyxis panaciterrae]